MERSQSCSNFDVSNSSEKNNNNTTNNNNNHIIINNASALKLRQAIELRQTQLQIQHQQQQLQLQLQLHHAGSSDNINATAVISSATTNLPHHTHHFPSTMRKKKMLQRQKSTEFLDDDIEYAADREEEEGDDEHYDHQITIMPLQKHLQFQQHKPLSASALLINCSLPSTPSMATQCSTSSSTSAITMERRRCLKHEESFDSMPAMGNSGDANSSSPSCRRQNFGRLMRDNSIHSDSSRYSSVDSLLEARKPDPEAILINLGFGPAGSEDILSRIPKRFLKPSQVRGIDTEAFVKRLQLASSLADHSALGYRGLTGNPDVPPSSIVAKIMQRFEVNNERKNSMGSVEHTIR